MIARRHVAYYLDRWGIFDASDPAHPIALLCSQGPESEAHARQIVTAVNHHAALVDVVRWFVRLNGTSDPQGLQELRDLAQQGRALLAQIEEAQR